MTIPAEHCSRAGHRQRLAKVRPPDAVIVLVDRSVAVAIGSAIRRESRLPQRIPPHRVVRRIDDFVLIVVTEQRGYAVTWNEFQSSNVDPSGPHVHRH